MASNESEEEITQEQQIEDNENNPNQAENQHSNTEEGDQVKGKEIIDSRIGDKRDEPKPKSNTDDKTKSGTKNSATQRVWNKKGKNTQTHTEPAAHLTNKTHWPTPEEAKLTPGEKLVEVPTLPPRAPSPKGGSNINWVPMKDAIPPSRRGRRKEGAPPAGRARQPFRGGRGGQQPTRGNYPGPRPNMNGNHIQNPMNVPPANYPLDTVPSMGTSYYFDPLEGGALREAILAQIEYYFSIENLCKDIWFRKQMDSDGYVPLTVISNFNRVKMLTQEELSIIDALYASSLLDLNSTKDKVRLKKEWQLWIFPAQDQSNGETHRALDAQALEQHV